MGQIMGRDPNNVTLHCGIAGAVLPVDLFDFGEGIFLRRTYAHFMNPSLMAFARAEPGKPHPAPWKSVSGGDAFDIEIELVIPRDFNRANWFDKVNTAWWIVALLRLRSELPLRLPILSDVSFDEIVRDKGDLAIWRMEINSAKYLLEERGIGLTSADLEWIKKYWLSGSDLMRSSEKFNAAFQAFDQSAFSSNSSLGLIMLWGGLERLFCGTQQELSFRTAVSISSYIEPRGVARYELYKRTKKLYGERSKAAHGNLSSEISAFQQTHAILRRALIKMIEENIVPTTEGLEANIFT